MVNDVSTLTAKELNPVVEAWNQQRFRDLLWSYGDNSNVTAPELYWDYCGPRTICMERVSGIPMDHFDEIRARGLDGELVLRRGAKAWAEAVMVHGPFHGDLHAGNIWVLDDGRGCFLDFGIMGELTDQWRQVMRDIYYTCVFDRNFTRVATAYRAVGVFPRGFRHRRGDRCSHRHDHRTDAGLGYGLSKSGRVDHIERLPHEGVRRDSTQELMLVGKQLLYIERYTRELAPDYAIITDPFIVKNIFPEAAKELATKLGTTYPD